MNLDEVTFRLIAPENLSTILPLVEAHNPRIPPPVLAQRLAAMREQGYQCLGGYTRKEELIAVCGIWITTRFWCGKQLELDNLIVAESYRGAGIGRRLMQWIHDFAISQNCDATGLDCYVGLHRAHKFYMNEGYSIAGYHFHKPLS